MIELMGLSTLKVLRFDYSTCQRVTEWTYTGDDLFLRQHDFDGDWQRTTGESDAHMANSLIHLTLLVP